MEAKTQSESVVTVHHVEGNELHHRYPRQTDAQRVYAELDCKTGRLGADWSGEIGSGVPVGVYHGHTQRWHIPALRADAANDLLDRIAPLAERVVAGYESEWDGHNHVAQFDDDAQEAIDAIQDLCEREDDLSSQLQVWDAGDWLAAGGNSDWQCRDLGITATTTDDELAEIGLRLETEAREQDVDVLENLDRHLGALRQHAIDEASEE